MTPTATTSATDGTQNGERGGAAVHRRKLRRPPGPRGARRVSGPLRGAGAATAQRLRPPSRLAPASAARRSLGAAMRAFLRSLPDHVVIDRLVRGRAWILALGVMLAGIVAMQVEILKLGASIGRSVQRTSDLEVRNEQLQASVAALADDQRIERMAAQIGMVMTPPTSVGFLPAGQRVSLSRALGNVHTPDANAFLNSPATNGSVVTPASIAAANAPAGASTSSASSPGSLAAASASTATALGSGSGTGATQSGTGGTAVGTGAASAGAGATGVTTSGSPATGTTMSGTGATGATAAPPGSSGVTAPASASAPGASSSSGG